MINQNGILRVYSVLIARNNERRGRVAQGEMVTSLIHDNAQILSRDKIIVDLRGREKE